MQAQATVDRWDAMLLQLAGQRVPPLPRLPGRRHMPAEDHGDAVAAAWEALHGVYVPPARPRSTWGWMTERANELGGRDATTDAAG